MRETRTRIGRTQVDIVYVLFDDVMKYVEQVIPFLKQISTLLYSTIKPLIVIYDWIIKAHF